MSKQIETEKENKPTEEKTEAKELEKIQQQIQTLEQKLTEEKQLKDKLDKLLEKLTPPPPMPEQIAQDNLSSVYNNVELKAKQVYTKEEAEAEIQERLRLLRESKGKHNEELYWGKQPTDLWAYEYLESRGHIKSLDDFNRVKSQAAKHGI